MTRSAEAARRGTTRPRRRAARRLVTIAVAGLLLAAIAPSPTHAQVLGPPPTVGDAGASCANGWTATDLQRYFGQERRGFYGADYQRVFRLPNGKFLWMFQDAFTRTTAGTLSMQHNAGLLQSGRCFTLLNGGSGATSWLLQRETVRFRRWFWPMGGAMGADGLFHLFMAEMVEPGPTFLSQAHPVAMWKVTLRVSDLKVITATKAPDPSADLFGWSVTSDATYSYLYSHCYRQFPTHDTTCSGKVKVARVPRGRFDDVPTYWDGSTWQHSRLKAVSVMPAVAPDGTPRTITPSQVIRAGDQYVAITKDADWKGLVVHLDRATRPQGPWTTYYTFRPPRRCGECNHYFASFVPWTNPDGTLIAALSNNRWDGALSPDYRPTFFSVPAPVPVVPPPVVGGTGLTAPATFTPITPCRLTDTRADGGPPSATVVTVQAAGRCGIPAEATSVALSITSIGSTGFGAVTAYPAGGRRPASGQLYHDAGQLVTNGTVTRLGSGGAIDVHRTAPTHVLVDVNGWFAPAPEGGAAAGRFAATPPARIYDSAAGGRARPAPGSTTVVAIPTGLVPADAVAVAVTIGTRAASGRGAFTLFPAGAERPTVNHLSTDTSTAVRTAGQLVGRTADGIAVHSSLGNHFTLDVVGYFTGPSAAISTRGLFVPGTTVRQFDTRQQLPAFLARGIRTFTMGVAASAVLAQATLLRPTARFSLTLQPGGAGIPYGIHAQANPGQIETTMVASGVAPNGTVNLTVTGTGHLMVDRLGWFTP